MLMQIFEKLFPFCWIGGSINVNQIKTHIINGDQRLTILPKESFCQFKIWK